MPRRDPCTAAKAARADKRSMEAPQSICGVLLNDFEVTDLGVWRQMSGLLVKLAHDAEVHHGADGLDVHRPFELLPAIDETRTAATANHAEGRCRLGGRRLEPIALGLSEADGDRRAEAGFATRRGSGRTRTGAHRNSSRRRIVASTANHECDLMTKRFWSRVSKQQVHRLERKRPSNRVVSGLHRKLESLARRARQDIAEAVGAWKRSRGRPEA